MVLLSETYWNNSMFSSQPSEPSKKECRKRTVGDESIGELWKLRPWRGSPYVFPLSDPPIPPPHTRHLKQSFCSSPIEALQSNSSKKEGEGKKRRLLDFLQSKPFLISGGGLKVTIPCGRTQQGEPYLMLKQYSWICQEI